MSSKINEIRESVIKGEADLVQSKVKAALEDDLPPDEILKNGLISAMGEVGERFEQGDFFVPEMLIAARAMKSGLSILKPLLVEENIATSGKIVIGTVKGDLHDIGKNLVAMMLEGGGFEVHDLGTDVTPERFGEAAREYSADVVGMSALLTTTMQSMKSTIEALEDMGVRRNVKVIIGGAPVTESFTKEIGADGYAPDASRAVSLVKSLMGVS